MTEPFIGRRTAIPALCVLGFVLVAAGPIFPSDEPVPESIPAHRQRSGDPEAGYAALISGAWVGCGLPALPYDWFSWLVPARYWPETLPGRPAGDEDLPFFLNRFTTKAGVDVLAPNCLFCHAGRVDGELVVGLGNADGRYHVFGPEAIRVATWIDRSRWLYFWSPSRWRETRKVGERMAAVAPYIGVEVQGANPTHNLAWSLIMHRDRHSLEWMGTPQIDAAPLLGPPSDVPPWWRMAKKHALFAAAGGQGDHTGFTAVNSTLCVDSVDEFLALYDYFDDIHAYIVSLQPPKYPRPIDEALRARGEAIFSARCVNCHGTYDEDPARETYPNRLIELDVIKTDPELARYNVIESRPATEWLNDSVFTRFGEYKPYLAYVAPPLDGIWATAPFLHNGSVPTLRALLKSDERPEFWTRSYDSVDFDPVDVGWLHTVLPSGQRADAPDDDERKQIVDTTLYGMSNRGHTFSDNLSDDDVQALLEYLKSI